MVKAAAEERRARAATNFMVPDFNCLMRLNDDPAENFSVRPADSEASK